MSSTSDATGAMGARHASRMAARELVEAGVPEPAASADILLAELLGVGRLDLTVRNPDLTREQRCTYEAWIHRRKNREPVQRILGYAYFRNLKLRLNDETLIPRSDTESVVEATLEYIDRFDVRQVLDVGTGSGAIAISIAQERPGVEVYATDTSEVALKLAEVNAANANVEVDFRRVDLVSGLDELKAIDLLVSNPPYVKSADIQNLTPEVRDWDPVAALDGGRDGLDFYRRIFAETPSVLKRGGHLVLEIGDGQAEAVLDLGTRAGFTPLATHPDLTGKTRAVRSQWGT